MIADPSLLLGIEQVSVWVARTLNDSFCRLACLHESPWRDPREEQGFKSCGEDREA